MQIKKVMFVLPCMKGGGAERVAALLANEFHQQGIETSIVLTSTTPLDVVRIDLKEAVSLKVLSEETGKENPVGSFWRKFIRLSSSLVCRLFEELCRPVPAWWAYCSFWSQYRNEMVQLRAMMQKNPETCVIAFLQPSIPIILLAARGLRNRVIISERGDPRRLMKKRYGRKFIEKYYGRADAAVFQTEDAKNTYPPCVSEKGVVIPNPIKADLPAPYQGARNKNITTFCRISAQKNLPVLFEAFRMLHQDYPDYTLRIIGDAVNDEGRRIEAQLKQYVHEHQLEAAVGFEPFKANVHEAILEDAMYVNSSDYEGISNAMLEAMAIGMPVVCTECPIGGAKATIFDSENGLLVPVGDSSALYRAMKRLIEEPELAQRISRNAAMLRDELTLESIAKKWMELL